MGLKVCKFGGTSLADAEAVSRVVDIVRSDPSRRYVVVSAPGKRHGDDVKITDLLLTCHYLARHRLEFDQPFSIVRERFEALARGLAVDIDIAMLLDELEGQIRSGGSRDLVASRGEYICGRLLARALDARFLDPAEGILVRASGRVLDETYPRMAELLSGNDLTVIPGFYGVDMHGDVHTFTRGGSDITGSIVARAVGADVYENWTDVDGLLMTDPEVVPEAEPIREVTYQELRELSYMGARVLHEEAISPIYRTQTPIHIRNTWQPEAAGTIVVASRDHRGQPVVGVAGRTGASTIYLYKALMNEKRGFGRRALEILEVHDINWLHAPTGIDSMSIVVWDEELKGKGDSYLEELRRILEPDRLEVLGDLALIATVGQGMASTVGIAGRLFSALATAGVNVRMIDQGSSEINIVVAVNASDYAKAVKAVYEAFQRPLH